jgi:hypothetical protein
MYLFLQTIEGDYRTNLRQILESALNKLSLDAANVKRQIEIIMNDNER